MTVGMVWMRCLDKRDHVIPDGAEYLGAGQLKAACKRPVYLLSVSAESPRRCCRACQNAVRAASKSPLRRVPEQRTRSRVVSEIRALLTANSLAFPLGPGGRPYGSGIPTGPIPRPSGPGRGSTLLYPRAAGCPPHLRYGWANL